MTRLATPSGDEIYRVLLKAGFEHTRTTGGHQHLRHPLTRRRTIVANHSGEFPRSMFKKIIRQAGLTEDQFRELLLLNIFSETVLE